MSTKKETQSIGKIETTLNLQEQIQMILAIGLVLVLAQELGLMLLPSSTFLGQHAPEIHVLLETDSLHTTVHMQVMLFVVMTILQLAQMMHQVFSTYQPPADHLPTICHAAIKHRQPSLIFRGKGETRTPPLRRGFGSA